MCTLSCAFRLGPETLKTFPREAPKPEQDSNAVGASGRQGPWPFQAEPAPKQ